MSRSGLAVAVLAAVVAACSTSGTSGVAPEDGGNDGAAPGVCVCFKESDASCVPKTCEEQGFTCGDNGDGCGGIVHCGTCRAPDYCGGGGFSRCGDAGAAPSDAAADSDGGPVCAASAGCPQGQVCCAGDHEGLACFSFCVASYQLCRTSADCLDTAMVCGTPVGVALNPAWGTVCWWPADGGSDGETPPVDDSSADLGAD